MNDTLVFTGALLGCFLGHDHNQWEIRGERKAIDREICMPSFASLLFNWLRSWPRTPWMNARSNEMYLFTRALILGVRVHDHNEWKARRNEGD